MSSIKKILTSGVAVLAVAATLLTGTAPAQAHDNRNAALIGGLVVGALIGGALASADQSYQGDEDHYDYYPAPRRYYSGYSTYRSHDDDDYAPRYYRDCDDNYQNAGDAENQ
ncbi:MAG: hypothetical protein KGK16_18540 [Bradyrhizobium sp.]|nr:hypothetical protein [Bradyrhizobium sp.]